eukprot:211612-Chlamydomonas_euryale.AAC.1
MEQPCASAVMLTPHWPVGHEGGRVKGRDHDGRQHKRGNAVGGADAREWLCGVDAAEVETVDLGRQREAGSRAEAGVDGVVERHVHGARRRW